MQLGHTLSPNGIFVSQKVHAAVAISLLVVDEDTN
jgi:hypothetical protein